MAYFVHLFQILLRTVAKEVRGTCVKLPF